MRPVSPHHGLVLDLALVVAVVTLALGHAIPGQAALGVITTIVGGKLVAQLRGGGPGPGAPPPLPPTPGSSAAPPGLLRLADVSIAALVAVALLALLVPSHDGRAS